MYLSKQREVNVGFLDSISTVLPHCISCPREWLRSGNYLELLIQCSPLAVLV